MPTYTSTVIIVFITCFGISYITSTPVAPLACHTAAAATGLATPSKLTEIDGHLDNLYNVIRVKDVEYGKACNYSVKYQGNDTEVALLLERFELLRTEYERGLWGYCSAEGASSLKDQIQLVIEAIGTDYEFKICDHRQLLSCDKAHNVCTCLQDTRNFRKMRSEYWIGKPERCVLKQGSDCPFLIQGQNQANQKVTCHPGRYCRFKGSEKQKKKDDCYLPSDMQLPVMPDSLPPTSTYRFRNLTSLYHNPYCRCYGFSGANCHYCTLQKSLVIFTLLILNKVR